MKELADIGLIGLAVMGENLVLNMESKGFTVAVFNRTVAKVDKFIEGRGAGKNFIGAHSIEELVKSLKRPRKVMLLVKAGKAVDDFIDQIIPHLEPGDIVTHCYAVSKPMTDPTDRVRDYFFKARDRGVLRGVTPP